MDNLAGKVAIVTGAASGIGLAMIERFLAEGMRVVAADIEEPALMASTNRFRDEKFEVEAVTVDVSDSASVESLANVATERFGAFHVVCNNAGVAGHLGRLWETPLRDFQWVIDVNLWGIIHAIRTFVPRLVAQGEGHVVNTASLAAWSASPAFGPYAATKHAVLALSEALRRELEQSGAGVGVSVLCPGLVNTRIMDSGRNWPAVLGQEPPEPRDPLSSTVLERLKDGITDRGVAPAEAADAVVKGILSNRFILTTHPDQLLSAATSRLEAARIDRGTDRGNQAEVVHESTKGHLAES